MRLDARGPEALRPVTITRNYTKHAPGSVLIAIGDTKVICTATLDPRVPPWLKGNGQGWVTAEYAMLPRSSQERIPRDSVRKGRAMEISRIIGRSLRAAVDLKAMGECQVILDCDVIQADGGTRTAAITGAFVALYDALRASVEAGNLAEVPITSPCAAVSVGVIDGMAMLDLCYDEDARAEVDMNIVMNEAGRFIEVQGCAESYPFPRAMLLEILDLAEMGIRELIAKQKEALGLA